MPSSKGIKIISRNTKRLLSLRHGGAMMSKLSYHRDFSSSGSSFVSEGLTKIHAAASAVVEFAVVAVALAAAAAVAAVAALLRRRRC